MIARKQEIGLQLNQLIDALLLGGVFWICHLVSVKGLVGPASPTEVPGFTHFLWMLAVVVPFTPFLLELNGFYNYQLDKSLQGSMSQIIQAGFWLLVVLGVRLFSSSWTSSTSTIGPFPWTSSFSSERSPPSLREPEQNKPIHG